MEMRDSSMRSFGRFTGVFESSSTTAMYRVAPYSTGAQCVIIIIIYYVYNWNSKKLI